MKNILIDLDNTLLDSNEAHETSFKIAIQKYFPNLSFDYKNIKGLGTKEALKFLDIDGNKISRISKMKSHNYLFFLKNKKVSFFSDSLHVMNELKNLKYNIYICTAASDISIQTLLDYGILSFDKNKIFTTEQIGFSKKNPHYWTSVLSIINSQLNDVIVIDDSFNVLMVCKSLGMKKLFHAQCSQKCDDYLECVYNLEDLLPILENLC